MIPTAQECYPERRIIFQQDLVGAQDIQNWFREWPKIKQITWPPKLPDLNVIENVWVKLKKEDTGNV